LLAIDLAQQRCREAPEDRAAWMLLIDLLERENEWLASIEVSRYLTNHFDGWAEPWVRLSIASAELGLRDESYDAAIQALTRAPENPRAQAQLGLRRVEAGERLDGMARLLEASQLSTDPLILLCRGLAHLAAQQPEPAEYWLQRGLRLAPDSDSARRALAHLYEQTGRLDQALDMLSGLTRVTGASQLTEAIVLRRRGEPTLALELLGDGDQGLTAIEPSLAALERARCLEALHRFDDAWDSFTLANRLVRDRSPFGTEALELFEQSTAWWARRSASHVLGPAPPANRTPLAFLVGIPRSGTTTVEQIIVSAGVTSTSECVAMPTATVELATVRGGTYPDMFDDVDADGVQVLRTAYWEVLARWLVPDSCEVLDKLPLNLLHLAAIERAFPTTRLVMIRRDPRDVVLSLYTQQFVDNPAMALTNRLDSAADLFIAGTRLWDTARPKLSVPTIEVRYEDLVTEPAQQVEALGNFLGLDLDRATPPVRRLIGTPSYTDATEPLHQRAVGRWRRFEAHLQPVLAKLQPWIDDYENGGGTSS
jgi:tetratricopeptide (TPR) repeat protein